jgi:hypothetical protein
MVLGNRSCLENKFIFIKYGSLCLISCDLTILEAVLVSSDNEVCWCNAYIM